MCRLWVRGRRLGQEGRDDDFASLLISLGLSLVSYLFGC